MSIRSMEVLIYISTWSAKMNAIDIVKDFLNYIRTMRGYRYLSAEDYTLLNHYLHQMVKTLQLNGMIIKWVGSMQRYNDRMYIFMSVYDMKGKVSVAEMYIPC